MVYSLVTTSCKAIMDAVLYRTDVKGLETIITGKFFSHSDFFFFHQKPNDVFAPKQCSIHFSRTHTVGLT